MNKREEIINSLKNSEDKVLIVKIIDYIEQVEKYFEPRFTQFLDPSQIVKAKKVLCQYRDIKYLITGGPSNCERNIITIYPDYMSENDIELPITAVCIMGNSRFENITHRDILGALMSLGIKREKIGDIIISDDSCYLIAYTDISNYIKLNLNRIRHTHVEIEFVNFDAIPEKQEKCKQIVSSVASLRLDTIISAGFGETRSGISKEIIKGNVKVNWKEVTNLSYSVRQWDVISLKGKGRIVLDSIGSNTRKGRINIVIKKII